MFLPHTHTSHTQNIYINNNKGSKRKPGGDEYVYGFDGGEVSQVYTSSNSSSFIF